MISIASRSIVESKPNTPCLLSLIFVRFSLLSTSTEHGQENSESTASRKAAGTAGGSDARVEGTSASSKVEGARGQMGSSAGAAEESAGVGATSPSSAPADAQAGRNLFGLPSVCMHTCTHARTHARTHTHTHTHEDGHADPDHDARTSQLLIRRNRALCRLICPTPLPSINSCSCQQSLRN